MLVAQISSLFVASHSSVTRVIKKYMSVCTSVYSTWQLNWTYIRLPHKTKTESDSIIVVITYCPGIRGDYKVHILRKFKLIFTNITANIRINVVFLDHHFKSHIQKSPIQEEGARFETKTCPYL